MDFRVAMFGAWAAFLTLAASPVAPPPEFTNSSLALSHGQSYVSEGVTVGEWLALLDPGTWEPEAGGNWIYHIHKKDSLTKKKSNLALEFVVMSAQDVAVSRGQFNGTELSSEQVYWSLRSSIISASDKHAQQRRAICSAHATKIVHLGGVAQTKYENSVEEASKNCITLTPWNQLPASQRAMLERYQAEEDAGKAALAKVIADNKATEASMPQSQREAVAAGQQAAIHAGAQTYVPGQVGGLAAAMRRQQKSGGPLSVRTTVPQPISNPPSDTQSSGPAFDCSKASTPVEKTICASPDLSMKDRLTAKMYRMAMARHPEDKALFLKGQREFLRERNACSASDQTKIVGCIDDAYLEQGDKLNEPSGGNVNFAPFHRGDEEDTQHP